MKKFIFAFTALLLTFTLTLTAHATDINTYKAQGAVGEQSDGMLGVPDPANTTEDIFAFVSKTNAQRMKEYNAIAASNGATVEQVKALAGAQLMANTPKGQYIRNAAGVWIKK
jgi:uncharacterized protein YdbL (DUF1318 family)